jgi:8-oxo-dGTP pyrophosphatase MutT (NUDIX family)
MSGGSARVGRPTAVAADSRRPPTTDDRCMARDPIPTWFFVKVVVRQADHFLLVQECSFGQTWHLPAGRVEPGETLLAAAIRETLEETSVPIVLEGILRVEHSPYPDKAFLGVIFLAHPAAEVPPKSTPDDESMCATWFTFGDIQRLSLREPDVLEVLRYVVEGGQPSPLTLLAAKGAAFV